MKSGYLELLQDRQFNGFFSPGFEGKQAMKETDEQIGTTMLTPSYRSDLRTTPPDVFERFPNCEWSSLSWGQIGRPCRVENYSTKRASWEKLHQQEMPVPVQWKYFNRRFHELFMSDLENSSFMAFRQFKKSPVGVEGKEARNTLRQLIQLKVWNKVHRVEDAVWDPRGKRALFEGLNLSSPKLLMLGAADGYEAMQLLAMYPGGHALLVDYDDFCRKERFGQFPESYPFLGRSPQTGGWKVYHREDFDMDFEVADIRDLSCGREFDIVLSVGLIEHFPDQHKPLVLDLHRRFLKPGGLVIMTTPRRQIQSRLFYWIMAEIMNFGYRELMDVYQMGLYAYENGFDILRAGYIKAHNGIVAQSR